MFHRALSFHWTERQGGLSMAGSTIRIDKLFALALLNKYIDVVPDSAWKYAFEFRYKVLLHIRETGISAELKNLPKAIQYGPFYSRTIVMESLRRKRLLPGQGANRIQDLMFKWQRAVQALYGPHVPTFWKRPPTISSLTPSMPEPEISTIEFPRLTTKEAGERLLVLANSMPEWEQLHTELLRETAGRFIEGYVAGFIQSTFISVLDMMRHASALEEGKNTSHQLHYIYILCNFYYRALIVHPDKTFKKRYYYVMWRFVTAWAKIAFGEMIPDKRLVHPQRITEIEEVLSRSRFGNAVDASAWKIITGIPFQDPKRGSLAHHLTHRESSWDAFGIPYDPEGNWYGASRPHDMPIATMDVEKIRLQTWRYWGFNEIIPWHGAPYFIDKSAGGNAWGQTAISDASLMTGFNFTDGELEVMIGVLQNVVPPQSWFTSQEKKLNEQFRKVFLPAKKRPLNPAELQKEALVWQTETFGEQLGRPCIFYAREGTLKSSGFPSM